MASKGASRCRFRPLRDTHLYRHIRIPIITDDIPYMMCYIGFISRVAPGLAAKAYIGNNMWGYNNSNLNDINHWTVGQSRIYKYRRAFTPPEFITIVRQHDNIFKALPTQSTYDLGELALDKIQSMIRSLELVLYSDSSWSIDVHFLKTGGCDMGCWATSSPNDHSPNCRLYRGKPKI
jgi:hypothetical protein